MHIPNEWLSVISLGLSVVELSSISGLCSRTVGASGEYGLSGFGVSNVAGELSEKQNHCEIIILMIYHNNRVYK